MEFELAPEHRLCVCMLYAGLAGVCSLLIYAQLGDAGDTIRYLCFSACFLQLRYCNPAPGRYARCKGQSPCRVFHQLRGNSAVSQHVVRRAFTFLCASSYAMNDSEEQPATASTELRRFVDFNLVRNSLNAVATEQARHRAGAVFDVPEAVLVHNFVMKLKPAVRFAVVNAEPKTVQDAVRIAKSEYLKLSINCDASSRFFFDDVFYSDTHGFYESKRAAPAMCWKCGRVGHLAGRCNVRLQQPKPRR